MATIEEKIAGLYVAFFNRAADKEGLNYWNNTATAVKESGGDALATLKKLSAGFAVHEKFTSLYSDLDDQLYVEAIYINTLGQAGDIEGIAYWKSLLGAGMSRSDMVAEFVSVALDFEKDDPRYIGLSQEDLDAAQQRKDLLANKVAVSLDFIDKMDDKTNITNFENLEEDPAYAASIKILSEVTEDIETVNASMEINTILAQNLDTALDILNNLETITENNPANISGEIIGAVIEDTSLSVSGQLTSSDFDNDDDVFIVVTAGAFTNKSLGSYEVLSDGTWTYTLNNYNTNVDSLSNLSESLSDDFYVQSQDLTKQLISITITGTNDTPKLVAPIQSSMAQEDVAFSYDISEYFVDVDDGDLLSYNATLIDAEALPGWLSIDSQTGVFTGTPLNDDVSSIEILVRVTDLSSATLTETFTLDIQNTNDTVLGNVTIVGEVKAGKTLELQTDTLTDEDGLGSFTYQWRADGVDITGATQSSFVLTNDEVGKSISAEVSYTDLRGTSESISSALSSLVQESILTPDQPTLSSLSDLGISDSDRITNDNTPTLIGLGAQSGFTVTLSSDIDGAVGNGVVQENGTWSITTVELSDGSHTFTSTIKDLDDNESTSSSGLIVTIDTLAPQTPNVNLVSSDNIINNSENISGFNVTGTAQSGNIIEVSGVSLSAGNSTIVDSNGTWSIAVTEGTLGEGENLLEIKQRDVAGNTSSVTTSTLLLDTTADQFSDLAVSIAEDTITSSAKNSVEFSIAGLDADSVAEVMFSDSSFNTLKVEVNTNGIYTVDLSSLNDSSIIAFVSVIDTAGNTTTGATDSVAVYDTNAIAYKNLSVGPLSSSSTQGISALASGSYWNVGSNGTVTYSFNTSIPSEYYSYGSDLTSGWQELSLDQKVATRTIFTQIEELININFVEVADTFSQSDGDVQLNIVAMDQYTEGFAFYPGNYYNYEGDVFLTSVFNTNPDEYGLEVGEKGWGVIVHEIGHALGLEHSFDNDHTTVLPGSLDDVNHTVMSYTNQNMIQKFDYTESGLSATIQSVGTYIEPQLYSLMDIATLQYIYGANLSTNTGDNVYTFEYTDYEIYTIWDAGGEDTIDVSAGIGSSTIDLNPGSLNSVDEYTIAQIIAMHQAQVDVSGNNFDDYIVGEIYNTELNYGLYKGQNNLGIATGTIIENVKTGSGNDTITDNEVDNIIQTFLGNDSIYLGNGGFDMVDGGEGFDTIYINSSVSSVVMLDELNDGSYNLIANNFGVNFIGIETIQFTDDTWTIA